MFSFFNKKEKEVTRVDIGQIEVFIELYNGKIISHIVKGTKDDVFECYSPCENQLSYFLEKVRKDNVLEISKGYFLNIKEEIKSVLVGDRKELIVEFK